MAWERVSRWVVLSAAVMLCCGAKCLAQDAGEDHTCTVSGGAVVVSLPKGTDGHNFQTSHEGLQAGGGFQVWTNNQRSGFRVLVTANYVFQKFTASGPALSAAKAADPAHLANATAAHGTFSAVTLDPTVRYAVNQHWGLYGSGGFGWLRRSIGFTGANPATLQHPSGTSLLRLSSDSGAFDAGGGVNINVYRGLMAFAEVRVYRGMAINGSTTLVPISVGLRW